VTDGQTASIVLRSINLFAAEQRKFRRASCAEAAGPRTAQPVERRWLCVGGLWGRRGESGKSKQNGGRNYDSSQDRTSIAASRGKTCSDGRREGGSSEPNEPLGSATVVSLVVQWRNYSGSRRLDEPEPPTHGGRGGANHAKGKRLLQLQEQPTVGLA